MRSTQILGEIRSRANIVFKLRENREWCHALLTHPSSETVIQKSEAIGLLPLLPSSERVTDSDVHRAQGPCGLPKWVMDAGLN